MVFDLDQFTTDCRAALDSDPSHKLVREVVSRAVSDPTAVLKTLGEPSCILPARRVNTPLRRGNRPHQGCGVDLIRNGGLRQVDQCEHQELSVVEHAESLHLGCCKSEQ